MPTYAYPTNAEIRKVAQEKQPELLLQDPIFKHFPPVNKNASTVIWDQMDNYVGLQQVRGINGEFSRVTKTGAKRYVMTPGYYGEYEGLDEQMLTEMRPLGTMGDTIDVS